MGSVLNSTKVERRKKKGLLVFIILNSSGRTTWTILYYWTTMVSLFHSIEINFITSTLLGTCEKLQTEKQLYPWKILKFSIFNSGGYSDESSMSALLRSFHVWNSTPRIIFWAALKHWSEYAHYAMLVLENIKNVFTSFGCPFINY